MILSGEEIRRRLGDQISIDPYAPERLNTNSYNLTLHNELLVYEEVVLDTAAPNRYRRLPLPSEGLVLHPDNFIWGEPLSKPKQVDWSRGFRDAVRSHDLA